MLQNEINRLIFQKSLKKQIEIEISCRLKCVKFLLRLILLYIAKLHDILCRHFGWSGRKTFFGPPAGYLFPIPSKMRYHTGRGDCSIWKFSVAPPCSSRFWGQFILGFSKSTHYLKTMIGATRIFLFAIVYK